MKNLINVPKTFQIILFILFLSGCHFVSYYDSISYKNLTDLKGEMKVAFDAFSKNGAKGESDFSVLKNFKTELSKGYEYEKGKGKNGDTVAQWEILNNEIDEVIQRFINNNNELSSGYCQGKWMVFDKAFDIAIETENNKLKN